MEPNGILLVVEAEKKVSLVSKTWLSFLECFYNATHESAL